MSSTNDSLGGFQNCSGFDLDAWIAEDCSFTSSHRSNGHHNSQGFSIQSSGASHVQGSLAGNSHVTQREGDWLCEHCSSLNFAKRTRCNKCGAPKSRRANENAATFNELPTFGGPVGLYKKGDWPCTHCGNVNWARRDKCNVCNAPKPTSTEAPRTGRAGGHYDLQDPHDRQQHLSDEESFDEFGRRKKKKNTSNKYSGSVKMDSSGYTSCSVATTNSLDGQNAPLKLFFPPPPLCYLKGRTASMSSVSSRSSQYEDSPVAHNNNDDDVSVDE